MEMTTVRFRLAALAFGLAAMLGAAPAFAVHPDEVLADPALEKRARAISAGLRCLVCQNQSIDDSDAPLAGDLRRLVRARLEAKDSDDQVLEYVVARYGEFVLLRPPLKPETVILWASPIIVLLAGVLLAMRAGRAQREPDMGAADTKLTEAERAELDRILSDKS